jgi:hypothetical protein
MQRLNKILLAVFPRLLGALFIYAAGLKLYDPTGLDEVLEFDGLTTLRALDTARYAIVTVEIALGALLIFVPRWRFVLPAACLLLLIYSGQLAYLVFHKDAPACACLEPLDVVQDRDAKRRQNIVGIARNCCLILAALWTWIQLPARPKS